jgi:hypothetical protein
VHPYDDAAVMAGQGTIALEMLADAPNIDQLVVPIGGGGLISGIAVAAKAIKPADRDRRVEAASTPRSPTRSGARTSPIGGATLAEGHRGQDVGQRPLPIVRDLVSDIVLVDEPALERAVNAYRPSADHGGGRRAPRGSPPCWRSRALQGRASASCSAAATSTPVCSLPVMVRELSGTTASPPSG